MTIQIETSLGINYDAINLRPLHHDSAIRSIGPLQGKVGGAHALLHQVAGLRELDSTGFCVEEQSGIKKK